MIFKPFKKQKNVLLDEHRRIGVFCGKRSGKTEIGSIKAIKWQEEKPNGHMNGIDPFIGVIMAPTNDMLTRLSLNKFMLYAKPFIKKYTKNPHVIEWHDGSIIYGLSADRPERIEGIKANWIWLDEVFQMKRQLYLECLARTSDTKGYILATGSLGVQFINPKQHWAYQFFKEKKDINTNCYEWDSSDNPYMPKEEIENLMATLDPQTFRAMFKIDWDTVPRNAVFSDFTDDNVMQSIAYNPSLPCYISIDWGWVHNMAVGFFQYNSKTDSIYMIDEIVGPKITLEKLYNQIMAKPYAISDWCCDIAGNQEREQTGISNVKWFRDKNIHFKKRSTAINYGIAILRSYILNSRGKRRFYVSSKCVRTIDGFKQYRYNEKDGIILNENPIKENDDEIDMVRYLIVNFFDKTRTEQSFGMIPRR